MRQLRQAAARERRAPIYWWFLMALAMGAGLCIVTYHHSPHAAMLVAILLVAGWAAPLVAMASMGAPRRAMTPAPELGEGRYDEWKKQTRLLGRVLLYYEDNPNLSPDIRRTLHAAREDIRDTLKAHPLRDDLERVCQRVRAGAIHDIKEWFGREYRADIRELADAYEREAASQMDEDARLLALQGAVEKAAAMMSQNCMPRMLERERLACATDCSWLAIQAAVVHAGRVSPVDLSEMLVIEWSDFSEPWLPASALRRAMERLERKDPDPASPPPVEDIPVGKEALVIRNGKKYRRVRVRHKHRRHRNRSHGPSLADVFLSFGQWVRYSIRAWMLFR